MTILRRCFARALVIWAGAIGGAASELMWAGENGHVPARQAARHALERKMAAVTERLESLSRASARVQHMYIVEAPIVLVGTIIWGFGDLIAPSTGCAFG